jgi:hypothetical protein
MLDEAQFGQLQHECRAALAPFAQPDGTVVFAMPALLMSAQRPPG